MAQALIHVYSGFGPRIATLRHATLAARSWIENDAGSAQLTMPQNDEQANSRVINSGNLYVVQSAEYPVPWVGFLADRWREDGATLTVALRELPYLLAFTFSGSDDTYAMGAGAVLHEASAAALRNTPMPFRLGDFSDSGPYLSKITRDTSIFDLARQCASESGDQWWVESLVTPQSIVPTIQWRSRRGMDRRGSVALQERRNVAEWPTLEDRSGLPLASMTVVATAVVSITYAERERAEVQTDGRPALGRSAVTVSESLSDQQAATNAALAALAQSQRGGLVLQLSVTDQALWPSLRMDDTVRVRMPSYNLGRGIDGPFRITGIQLDETPDSGVMQLTMEAA